MNYEFMQQVAPMLAIPPDEGDSQGSWITPEQGNDQPLYGANGMPLNYIRDQGGPTQYYSPSGTAGLTADSGQMRATARTAPTPIQGLRGLTPDAPLNPAFNIRGRQAAAPQVAPPSNLLTGSAAAGGPVGQRGILTIPGQERQAPPPAQRRPAPTQEEIQRNLPDVVRNPIMGVHGQLRSPAEMDQWDRYRAHQRDPLYQGTRERLDIPPEGNSQRAPQYNPHAQTDRQRAQPNGANTLFDMFDQAGFRPPQFLLDLAGRGRILGEEVGRTGAQRTESVQDLRGRTADVQRTSQGGIPEFSTDQGLAEFNYRMFGDNTDRYLGNQVRTQAEQDDLYNRHLTTTRHSAHIGGRAYDYPASRLSGRREREAIVEVQRQMQAAGYDINQLEFRWESGQGRGQGTGPHVHVEPK
jgi:hypothetical protein